MKKGDLDKQKRTQAVPFLTAKMLVSAATLVPYLTAISICTAGAVRVARADPRWTDAALSVKLNAVQFMGGAFRIPAFPNVLK